MRLLEKFNKIKKGKEKEGKKKKRCDAILRNPCCLIHTT